MAVKIGSARIDENGRASGGAAGDQTGREVSTQAWYLHKKGWRVLRARDDRAAEKIARCMEMACANRSIGYDQGQRNSLYKAAELVGFDVSRVKTACETDCSALVRVCCAYAGITGLPSGFRTANLASNLLGTGAFVELKGAKYQEQALYLGRGDILVTKTSGHTAVVLTNGSRYEGALLAVEYRLGERTLRHGCAGEDVRLMQELLLRLGYDLGAWGCDGEFGDCTELAVRRFQVDCALTADGVCGTRTLEALQKAAEAADLPAGGRVGIYGGDCYLRDAPDTDGRILGVARRGSALEYAGETSPGGWLRVRRGDGTAWVSGRYGRLEAEAG